jgi:hypothetical protein
MILMKVKMQGVAPPLPLEGYGLTARVLPDEGLSLFRPGGW